MARVEIDPALVEEVVFLRVRRAEEERDRRADEWYRERESLFGVRDPLERQRAFVELGQRWFERFELSRQLMDALEHAPRLRRLARIRVRRALGRRDEGSDLVDAGGETRFDVALAPARFLDRAGFREFLVRECLYADDMLDPAFGYRAELGPGLDDLARTELVRDRLAVLWEARVRNRAAALLGTAVPPGPTPAFRRAFAGALDSEHTAVLHDRAAGGALSTFSELLTAARAELEIRFGPRNARSSELEAARGARETNGSPA